MRWFEVVVCPKKVTILEVEKPIEHVHVQANVDGDTWLYQIKKLPMSHMRKGWEERGYVQSYYHVKNGGEHVVFVRTNRPGYKRKLRHKPKQLQLF